MRPHRRAWYVLLLIIVPVMLSSWTAEAGSTGKIRGRVINIKTKEPVPSAPVAINGTKVGGLADAEGNYYINNVPPGDYQLLVNPAGYTPKIVKGVRVVGDHTTVIDVQVEQSVIVIEAPVVVVAPRDPLKIREAGNERVFTKEQLTNAPIGTLLELLGTTAGVTLRGGEMHVDGGRGNEAKTKIDGVPVNDVVGGYDVFDHTTNVATGAVEEIRMKKSNMGAGEIGALSAVVSVTTKEGGDRTHGHLEYQSDYFRTDILDKNSFDYDRLQCNLSGPEPMFAELLLPAIGIDWFAGRLKYALSGGYQSSNDYVSFEDYGSANAGRNSIHHNVLGMLSVTERAKNSSEARLKLTWQAGTQTKITFGYHYSWDDYIPFNWQYIYTPGTASRAEQSSTILDFHLTHQIDKSAFFELQVSRWRRDYLDSPSDPSTPGGRMYPGDFTFYDQWESFTDYDGDGVYDAPEPFINVNQDTSWYWGGPFYTVGDSWLFNTTVTNDGRQLNGVWPTTELEWGGFEWRENGARYGNWRGSDTLVNQAGNSSIYVDTILTDWNGNGVIDFYESEPFQDVNGDGAWSAGDYFNPSLDINGNGRFDAGLASNINVDEPEPYMDGDYVLGEPYTDVNLNGVYDEGIDFWFSSNYPERNQDLNYNSHYDGPGSVWSSGLPFKDLNGNGVYDAPNGSYDYGEPFLDLNGNGKWDSQDGFLDKGYDQWAHYNEKHIEIWTGSFNFTKQFSLAHELQAGADISFDDLVYADLQYPQRRYNGSPDGGAWPEHGAFRDFYHRRPFSGAIFAQDKMEYGSLVATVGLRYDYFVQSSDLKATPSEGFGESKTVDGSKNKISPRIGISYPISNRAKVFFNYGHYYQLPELSQMYQRATQATTAAGIIGNENLDYMKTVQYEVGVGCKLSSDYVLSLSGFYKDEFDKINSVNRSYGPVERSEYENVDYGRTRGLETQLEKNYGNFVSGYVNYTYMFAYGKSSSSRSNYFDEFYGRSIPIMEFPLDWDERHQVTLNLRFQIPASKHPRIFGLKLPDNCGFNAIWRFGSGFPFTPDKDYPGLRLSTGELPQKNSMRLPAHSNVDLRAWKTFPLLGLDFVCDLWVSNLFDSREVLYVHPTTGRYDTNVKPVGANYVLEGNDVSRNPLYLGPGRNVRVGIGVDF